MATRYVVWQHYIYRNALQGQNGLTGVLEYFTGKRAFKALESSTGCYYGTTLWYNNTV